MNILPYWPLKSKPRQTQIDAFNFFLENEDKKYFFISAPVGTGKSAIGVTIANYLKTQENFTSFILTPQKILQEQYEKSFNGGLFLSSIYGKNNYSCNSVNTDCETASSIRLKCNNCPYQAVLYKAKNSDHVVMNYALALRAFGHTDHWDRRSLMIMDECHQLENILTEHDILDISSDMCDRFNIPKWSNVTTVELYKWIKTVFFPNFSNVVEDLKEKVEPFVNASPDSVSFALVKMYNELCLIYEIVSNFVSFELSDIDNWFINVSDESHVKFKHLYGANTFKHVLHNKAEKFLFLSATIFDHEEYCNNLGIPLDQVAFFTCDSDFPNDNRPVVFIPTMKMSYGWDNDSNKNNRSKMIANIKKLLIEHKDEKGIIHTGNYQIAKWLVNELNNSSHEIWHHNPDSGDSRDKIIDAFLNSKKPAVLISPSITEGLDLVEDKSRFAIFAKVSFGALGDNWIKKRMEMSNNWYLLRALTDVIQGCGRVVRSKDDYGVCYILDSSWSFLFNKMKHKLPKWWLNGYHEV